MTQEAMPATVGDETRMALLCEEISDRLFAGQSVSLDEYTSRWPQHAEKLRKLVPAMQAMLKLPEAEVHVSELGPTGDSAQPLGDFRILQQIGRGGMGVVYEAWQLSLGRKVALKVLPLASVLDPRHLARFKNEAMAAAGLNHPHIVPVYAVGEERGVHYYAMQCIDGQNLAEIVSELRVREGLEAPSDDAGASSTELLASHLSREEPPEPEPEPAQQETAGRQAAVTKRSGSSRSEIAVYCRNVARIVRDAADALGSAHEEGVIHRDVKPSNLMLDARGKVWITDFGLARMRGNSAVTMTGDLLGTLRYMSPEQATGQRTPLDHRTDVYSLGATLYELLTLRPLFSGDDRARLLVQIAREEPIPPRRLRPGIPADLETITLKAVAKAPADRYAAMRDMVEDLDRYLQDLPIKAKRIGAVERTARLVRRHSLALAGSLAMTLLMTGTLAIAFWLTYQARNEAVAKGQEAKTQAKQAQERGQKLEKQNQQNQVILGRVTKTVDALLDRLASLPVGDAARQAIAEEELAFYQELARLDPGNSVARSQLAQSLHRLGHLQIDQQKLAQSQATFQKSIDLFEQLAAEEPDSGRYMIQLCHAWMNYGRAALHAGDLKAASKRMQKSIEYGNKAVSHSPNDPESRMALAFPWGQMGVIRKLEEQVHASLDAHQREITLHEQNVAAHPDNFGHRTVLGSAYMIYAQSLRYFKNDDAAKSNYWKALNEFQQLKGQRPEDALVHRRIAQCIAGIYICRHYSADTEDMVLGELEQAAEFPHLLETSTAHLAARAACRSANVPIRERALALRLAQQCVSKEPERGEYWNTLALAQYRCGEYQASLDSIEKSHTLEKATFSHDGYIEAMCHERLGRHEKALEHFQAAKRWMDDNDPANNYLADFRSEAAQVLGLSE